MGLVRRAQGARRRRCRRTSLTTSNAEIARNTHAPFGFRRHGGICSVACWRSSTMYIDIACVAPPCICPRGARNAMPPNTRTDS
jgi:DNA-binding MarR family transcriptional regulator